MKQLIIAFSLLAATGLGAFGIDLALADHFQADPEEEIVVEEGDIASTIVEGKYGKFNTENFDESVFEFTDGHIDVNIYNTYLGTIDFEESVKDLPGTGGEQTVLTASIEISNITDDSVEYKPENIKLKVNGNSQAEDIWLINKQNGIYSQGDTHLGEIAWILNEDTENIKSLSLELGDTFKGDSNQVQKAQIDFN